MPATPPIDPVDLRAWRDSTLYRLLGRASRSETAETVARIQSRGHATVSIGYANLLSNLDVEGTTISSLARRAGVTRQAASQQLVDIERDGYVVRQPDPADGRAVLVRQTPRGRALLATALDVVKGLEAEYAEAIGVEQLATLKETLAALLAHIDPGGALGRD